MNIFLLKEFFRIDGATGAFVESDYACDSMKYDRELSLRVARNQYASFQVGVVPEDGKLQGATVTFSDLKSEDGVISKENYASFIEWFHHVEGALVPDLLIPVNVCRQQFTIPLDEKYLSDQKAGALWVDLFIPKETKPGLYTGEVTVNADGVEKVFTLSLRVKSAVVPEGCKITADYNNYADSISAHFDSLKNDPDRYHNGKYFAVEKEFYRLTREHRGLFHNLPYKHSGDIPESFIPELEGEGKNIHVKSWELFDQHFGPMLDGSAFADSKVSKEPVEFMYLPFNLGWPASYEKWGKKGYRTEYRRILQEFVRHFEEKGWDKTYMDIILNNKKDYRFYPYTIDEIWYEHDEETVDIYYDIVKDIIEHSNTKFIFRMDSSNHFGHHFDHRFSDMFKMWVAGWGMFNWFPESVEVMKNKGNILWVYGGVLRSLKESLLSLFVWPIQCMMTGATGFCIWNTTGFGADYLNCPANLGGQALYYPGSYFGIEAPLPTVRMKALRNAMQTVELAMLLEGTPEKGKITSAVNKRFGLQSKKDWWREKPSFIDIPPRYWDFGKTFSDACLPPMHVGRNPLIAEEIANDIYTILCGEDEAEKETVQFRFY